MQFYYRFCLLILCLATIGTLNAQINFTANDQVPEVNDFFRYGVNPSFYPNWGNLDTTLANIAAGNPEVGVPGAGVTSWRATLPEWFINQFGNNVRTFAFEHYEKLGMTNHTVFLEGPEAAHTDQTQYCDGTPSAVFSDLYLDIWDNGENGTPVNDENHFALYCFNVATTYSSYVKFWEIWNEPDFTSTPDAFAPSGTPGSWWDNDPDPCDLKIKAPIYNYIRMLRIAYEVIKFVDPEAFITTGGIGYPSFLHAIMRNTDNPNDGEVSGVYPLKGGAYFDAVSFHQYPHIDNCYRIAWNNDIQNFDFRRHSDGAADCLLERQSDYQSVLAEFEYDGSTYPQKEYIITESNLPRKGIFGGDENFGNDEIQRNWVIKACVRAQQGGISQFHIYRLGEAEDFETATYEFALMGLYKNLNASTPYNQEYTDEGIAYRTMSEELSGYEYDAIQTDALNLPVNVEGAAFVDGNGNYKYVLWARTDLDTSEEAAASYSFPQTLNINRMSQKSWSSSVDGSEANVSASEIALTGSPSFLMPTSFSGTKDLQVDLIITDASCAGINDGSVMANPIGGTPPYIFQWSNQNGSSTASSSISFLTAGFYAVTVTDSQSNVVSALAMVNEPVPQVVDLETQTLNCNNSVATVFYLENNEQIFVEEHDTPGTYSTLLERDGECTLDLRYTIDADFEEPISDAGPAVELDWESCDDIVISAFLDGSNSSGGTNIQYQWSTVNGLILSGQNSTLLEYGASGTYTLVVTNTDNGCTAESSAVVVVNLLHSDFDVTGAEITHAIGNSGTGSIIPIVVGGVEPYLFEWDNGATTQILENLFPGNYDVTVTDAAGCSAIRAYTILDDGVEPSEIDFFFLLTNISCADAMDGAIEIISVQGGVPPYSYAWSDGSNSPVVTGLNGGEYSATITDSEGTTATKSVIIEEPAIIEANLMGPFELTCINPVVEIVYTHSNGEAFILGAFDESGEYSIPVNIFGECSVMVRFTIIEDLETPIADVGPNVSIEGISCFGEVVTLSIPLSGIGSSTGPEIEYFWSTTDGNIVSGQTEITCIVDQSGTYSLQVTDTENGCRAVAETTVDIEIVIVELEITDVVIENSGSTNSEGSISLSVIGSPGPFEYQWSNGATSESIENLEAGAYSLIVTDANGCSIERTFIVEQGPTSNRVVPDPVKVQVIPNPSDGFVQILANQNIWNVEVYTLSGKGVDLGAQKFKGNELNKQAISLDLSSLNPGCYLLKYQTEKGSGIEKLLLF